MARSIVCLAALLSLPLGCAVPQDDPTDSSASEQEDALTKSNPCKWATLGDGDYCSKSLNPNATGQNLYTCEGKQTVSRVKCDAGCVIMPPGQNDVCAEDDDDDPCADANLGDGDYCSKSLDPSSSGNTLYTCIGKQTASKKACASGCQVMPPGVNDQCAGGGGGGGSGSAVSRAREWIYAGMPYCGGVSDGTDYICGGWCDRPPSCDRPDWDVYRSDCSGYVSYAWGLSSAGGGRRTWEFAPFDEAVSYAIDAHDLQPGDALNSLYEDWGSQHIMLFGGWVDKANGVADILEEQQCGTTAMEHNIYLEFQGGSQIYISGYGPYAAIRKK